jgi:hypothetical protein
MLNMKLGALTFYAAMTLIPPFFGKMLCGPLRLLDLDTNEILEMAD